MSKERSIFWALREQLFSGLAIARKPCRSTIAFQSFRKWIERGDKRLRAKDSYGNLYRLSTRPGIPRQPEVDRDPAVIRERHPASAFECVRRILHARIGSPRILHQAVVEVGVETALCQLVEHSMGRPHRVVGTAQKNKPFGAVRALIHDAQGGEKGKRQ